MDDQRLANIIWYMPLPIIAILAVQQLGQDSSLIPNWLWVSGLALSVGLSAVGVYFVRAHRQIVANPVILDVRPNLISAGPNDYFAVEFSSATHFIASAELFEEAVSAMANRESHMKGRFFAPRESAHVRVWPGTNGLTPLELGEIAAAVRAEFVDPKFEVMEGGVVSERRRALSL